MSNLELRGKRNLIERFIERIDANEDTTTKWRRYIAEARKHEISTIIEEEKLRPEETREFMSRAFKQGFVPESGTTITRLMAKNRPDSRPGVHILL